MHLDCCIDLSIVMDPYFLLLTKLFLSEQTLQFLEILNMHIASTIVQHIIMFFQLLSEGVKVESGEHPDGSLGFTS